MAMVGSIVWAKCSRMTKGEVLITDGQCSQINDSYFTNLRSTNHI
jgi:hypothetical protein